MEVFTFYSRGETRKIGAKWLPHQLNDQDVELRVRAARKNLQWFERNLRILGRIIAIDKTYGRSYTPLDRQHTREWRLPGEGHFLKSFLI